MLFLNERLVVLDCEAEVACSYRVHRPHPGQFSLAQPYQAACIREQSCPAATSLGGVSIAETKGQVATRDASKQFCTAVPLDRCLRSDTDNKGSTAGPQTLPCSGEDQAAPDHQSVPLPSPRSGAGLEAKQPRKRKRKTHDHNERELESNRRHQAAQPFLLNAVENLHTWLRRAASSTIPAALRSTISTGRWPADKGLLTRAAGDDPSVSVPLHSKDVSLAAKGVHAIQGEDRCPTVTSAKAIGSAHCEQSSSQGFKAEHAARLRTDADKCTVDYLALASTADALRPKFRFKTPPPDNPGDHCPAENLFERLIVNDSAYDRQAEAAGHEVVIPGGARFMMSDITHLTSHVDDLLPDDGVGFHCVVVDPPWENASARRGAQYPTLPSRWLLGIPMTRLLQPGGLLALWVTNRERHRRFVESELLPAWGCRQVATWYWLKVTSHGELVGPLDVHHRRPYEVLLLAVPTCQEPQVVPHESVIIAVPSQHSRKPQLARLLQRYLPSQPQCLELFARELVAGWTSWGNQGLHFQSRHLFQPHARVCFLIGFAWHLSCGCCLPSFLCSSQFMPHQVSSYVGVLQTRRRSHYGLRLLAQLPLISHYRN